MNATYPVGRIDEESKKLIRTTRQCLDEAIKICKPGALIRDIGKTMYACQPSMVDRNTERGLVNLLRVPTGALW